jgi:hypothetical protein
LTSRYRNSVAIAKSRRFNGLETAGIRRLRQIHQSRLKTTAATLL